MKKILIVIFIIILFTMLSLASASSIVRIPVFSDIFYSRRVADLGVAVSQEALQSFSQKFGYTPLGMPIGNILPGPRTIQATDTEATSWINALCQEFPEMFPLRSFQIKFESGKIKSSAHIFEPFEADVTIFGEITRIDEKSVSIKFEKAYLGNLPAPKKIKNQLELQANKGVNEILKNVGDLRIDKIQILDREAIFIGIFPYWIPANEYITL